MPLDLPRAGVIDIETGDMTAAPTTVEIDDDGTVTINIGGNGQAEAPPPDTRFDRNLAADMDAGTLASLAAYVLEGIEADEQDRSEWLETVNRAADYLGVRINDPNAEVSQDGTVCQAVASCMLQVATKLWGTAYAELCPSGGPVKAEHADAIPVSPAPGVPAGPTAERPDSAGDDLAEALEQDLNWYLTKGDRGYYPDTAKMLMNRLLVGLAVKEAYHCPVAGKPLLRWIMAQDVIVQGSPPHLQETDGRVTIHKRISRGRMRRLQKAGTYLDVPLVRPAGDTSPTEITIGETQGISATPTLPRDIPHDIYECNIDLGGLSDDIESLGVLERDENGKDVGFPLPYFVTIDKDSRVILQIKRNWKKGDSNYKRRRRYVKYGFMPSFGGGFYDWGLLHLVGNPTQAATMLQRAGVDAGLFANFPAWAVAQGPASRMENQVLRPMPGEAVKFPTSSNQKIGDVMMPFPYKDVSGGAMALSDKLESDVKALGGVIDIPVGEGRIGNTPVGTIMSYIEATTMVPGAIHKMDHVSQAEEFDLLRELLAEDPEALWRGNPTPARKWQVAQELLSPDIAPQADPNTPSQIHRLLKVQGLITIGGLPQFQGVANNRTIFRKAVRVLTGEEAADFEMPQAPAQAPPPDPKIVAAQIKAQSEAQQGQQKLQIAALGHQGKMEEIAQEGQQRAADRDAANVREAMKLEGQQAKVGADVAGKAMDRQHDAGQAAADRAHDVGLAAMDHASAQQQALTAPLTAPDQGGGA